MAIGGATIGSNALAVTGSITTSSSGTFGAMLSAGALDLGSGTATRTATRLANLSNDSPAGIAINASNASGIVTLASANVIGLTLDINRNVVVSGTYVRTAPTTVSTLPACTSGLDGSRAFVTDDLAAVAFAAPVTGGGTNHVPVYCDGSGTPTWKIG